MQVEPDRDEIGVVHLQISRKRGKVRLCARQVNLSDFTSIRHAIEAYLKEKRPSKLSASICIRNGRNFTDLSGLLSILRLFCNYKFKLEELRFIDCQLKSSVMNSILWVDNVFEQKAIIDFSNNHIKNLDFDLIRRQIRPTSTLVLQNNMISLDDIMLVDGYFTKTTESQMNHNFNQTSKPSIFDMDCAIKFWQALDQEFCGVDDLSVHVAGWLNDLHTVIKRRYKLD